MRLVLHRLLPVGVIVVLLLALNPATANAAWLQYQSSPADTYNPPNLSIEYDITRVDFAVSDSDPSRYNFFLEFTKPVTANLFSDGLSSWAAIFLDLNGDGKIDYSIETDPNIPYNATNYHAALFADRSSGSGVTSSLCDARTWSSLDTQASWIGFSIPKTCLPFGPNLSIRGYSGHNGVEAKEFDYAPDTFWTFSLAGGAVSSIPGSSTSSNSASDLPNVSVEGASETFVPSNPPDNLVNLAESVAPSVVTVLCANSLGSGWAINAQMSTSMTNAGYRSYLITNHHVISDCTSARNITVVLANQTKVPAYVWSWDEANDVAGIVTGTYIPPLNWRGATPEQGWWVGVIGSPLGFPGILTTGIVSSNDAQTHLGTTTAPINHGNSGGPVFDRSGRVIGLATAKYDGSEGFGIYHGTPLLCGKIVNCASLSQVWTGVNSPTPTPRPTPTPTPTLVQGSVEPLNFGAVIPFARGRVALSSLVGSSAGLPINVTSISDSTCSWGGGDWIFFVAPGTCSFMAGSAGDSSYLPSPAIQISFEISRPISKSVTIICAKGKLTKKVTAEKPVCPSGYKKK